MVKKIEKRYDKGTNSKSDHIGELSPSISERKLTLSALSLLIDNNEDKCYN